MAEDFDIREQRNTKDKDFENALRPLRFEDFSGQTKVVENPVSYTHLTLPTKA